MSKTAREVRFDRERRAFVTRILRSVAAHAGGPHDRVEALASALAEELSQTYADRQLAANIVGARLGGWVHPSWFEYAAAEQAPDEDGPTVGGDGLIR